MDAEDVEARLAGLEARLAGIERRLDRLQMFTADIDRKTDMLLDEVETPEPAYPARALWKENFSELVRELQFDLVQIKRSPTK